MPIRPATLDDLEAIQACARAAYEIYVARMGKSPAPMVADFASQITAASLHVLEDGDTLCGFIVAYPRGDHLHLENVALHPAHQRRGHGRRLMDWAENLARSFGLSAVELYTNEKMTENITLYPHLGYSETARRCEDGFNRVFFRKEL